MLLILNSCAQGFYGGNTDLGGYRIGTTDRGIYTTGPLGSLVADSYGGITVTGNGSQDWWK